MDDHADTRELYRFLLTSSGATVTTAESGNTAWQRFRDHRPDLVLSDIHMRDGDGYELVRRIRALPADDGALIPAIAASALATPERSLEAGFHAHLEKPAGLLGLVDVVHSFVCEGTDSRATWNLDDSLPDIALLTFVGHVTGSWLARLVAKAACITLGTPCSFVDDWPPQR